MNRHRPAGWVAGLSAAVLLAGCGPAAGHDATAPGPGSAASPGPGGAAPAGVTGGTARVGDLRVTGAYLPRPASTDVAAAYFTVTDTGTAPDTLTAVRTDLGGTATMHRTQGGSMLPVTAVTVPAGGSTSFAPGGLHVMVEGWSRPVAVGDTVALTLTFAGAGSVTVTAPVTAYGRGPTGTASAGTPMAGMS